LVKNSAMQKIYASNSIKTSEKSATYPMAARVWHDRQDKAVHDNDADQTI